MRLVTYSEGGIARLGAIAGDRVVDLKAASRGELPGSMLELLALGHAGLEAARRALDAAGPEGARLSQTRLLAPIPRPPKNVIAIGLNYREHAIESARARNQEVVFPKVPVIFTKAPLTVIGPEAEIVVDYQVTQQPDWEVELAV